MAWDAAEYPKTDHAVNPYEVKILGKRLQTHSEMNAKDRMTDLTLSEVRKELMGDEEERLKKGGRSLHQTSATSFLIMGLELADAQYIYKWTTNVCIF